MYLLSLDDAGSPGNPVEEYFVLGGVCVYEAQVDWFSRELEQTCRALSQESRRYRIPRVHDFFEARGPVEGAHDR